MNYICKVSFLTILILGIVSVSGCSLKISNENGYVEGQDYQFYYCSVGSQPMAESEKGYYLFSGEYLYFVDKENMIPVIICNKPNCLHDEETDPTKTLYCNAFFEGAKSLFYYNESLYIFSSHLTMTVESEFIKIPLDGTQRKTLFKVDGVISSSALHRGVLYYATQVWNSDGQSLIKVNATKLSGKNKEIYQETFEQGNVGEIMCYGNFVFFKVLDFTEDGYFQKMMRHKILTGETEVIVDNPMGVSLDNPSFINDKVYYRKTKTKSSDMSLEYQEGFLADIDGSNVSNSFDPGYPVEVCSDGQYLYARDIEWNPFSKPVEEQQLTIYTMDGEVVDNIQTGFGQGQSIIPGGKEHMFLQQFDQGFFRIYYGEKSQISTGNFEWKLLFEIEQEKMFPAVKRNS